jgi:hypothetical protein
VSALTAVAGVVRASGVGLVLDLALGTDVAVVADDVVLSRGAGDMDTTAGRRVALDGPFVDEPVGPVARTARSRHVEKGRTIVDLR